MRAWILLIVLVPGVSACSVAPQPLSQAAWMSEEVLVVGDGLGLSLFNTSTGTWDDGPPGQIPQIATIDAWGGVVVAAQEGLDATCSGAPFVAVYNTFGDLAQFHADAWGPVVASEALIAYHDAEGLQITHTMNRPGVTNEPLFTVEDGPTEEPFAATMEGVIWVDRSSGDLMMDGWSTRGRIEAGAYGALDPSSARFASFPYGASMVQATEDAATVWVVDVYEGVVRRFDLPQGIGASPQIGGGLIAGHNGAWVFSHGGVHALHEPGRPLASAAASPDGDRVALLYSGPGEAGEIVLFDVNREGIKAVGGWVADGNGTWRSLDADAVEAPRSIDAGWQEVEVPWGRTERGLPIPGGLVLGPLLVAVLMRRAA